MTEVESKRFYELLLRISEVKKIVETFLAGEILAKNELDEGKLFNNFVDEAGKMVEILQKIYIGRGVIQL